MNRPKHDYPIYTTLPDGWAVIPWATTAPIGFVWINNRESIFSKDYKHGIVKIENLKENEL